MAAVQNTSVCFADPELKGAKIALNRLGLPLTYSGNFSVVFKLATQDGKEYAVKCFTRSAGDLQARYWAIYQHFYGLMPRPLVAFEYVERGILVGGSWFPILKMRFVNGLRLDEYIDECIRSTPVKSRELRNLSHAFRIAVYSLKTMGVAHGDLQHGNIIVSETYPPAVHFVDYDCTYVPSLKGLEAPEIGHPNYNHPARSSKHFDERIDNFPSIVIYLSIRAVASDPELWHLYHSDQNLILKAEDFRLARSGKESEVFRRLKSNPDPMVRELAKLLEEYCRMGFEDVDDLETAILKASNAVRRQNFQKYEEWWRDWTKTIR